MKILTPENENYAGTIVTIKELHPLEGSDRILGTTIFGSQAIVGVGTTSVGDKGIYFPAETQLSEEFAFENILVGDEFPTMTLGEMIDTIKLKDDGFILKDSQGTPKWVQARSYQIGYYSNRTTVYVKDGDKSVTLGELSGDVE